VKLIHFMHRRAKLIPLLVKCGFPPLHAQAPASIPATPETPVNAKPAILPDAKPVLHGAKYHALRGAVERGRYADMLRLLAADPLTPASAISTKMNITPAMVEHVVAAARETLGISGGRVSDGPRYEAACQALDVAPSATREPVRASEKPVVPPARTVLVRSPAPTTGAGIPVEHGIPSYTGHDARRARMLLRESQAAFAARFGISQPTLSALETANQPLSFSACQALHAILHSHALPVTPVSSEPKPTPAPSGQPIQSVQPGPGEMGNGPLGALSIVGGLAQVPLPRPLAAVVSHASPGLADMPEVRSALALLREAMRAEHVLTLVVNASEHDEEIPHQVVAAGTSAVRRQVIVSETLEA
jgi:DNA-binding XRE family transcriptional regulator